MYDFTPEDLTEWDSDIITQPVGRGLPLLPDKDKPISGDAKCYTCHHHSRRPSTRLVLGQAVCRVCVGHVEDTWGVLK